MPAPAVELAVEADGIYEVPEALLTAAGFDLAASPEDLLLTNDGKPVGLTLTGQGKDRMVRFYGQGPGRDAYGSQNIYWLSREAPGEAMPVQPVSIAARSAGGSTGMSRRVSSHPPCGPKRSGSTTRKLRRWEPLGLADDLCAGGDPGADFDASSCRWGIVVEPPPGG